MLYDDVVGLKKQRGKGLRVSLKKNATKDVLLKVSVDKHVAHSKDLINLQRAILTFHSQVVLNQMMTAERSGSPTLEMILLQVVKRKVVLQVYSIRSQIMQSMLTLIKVQQLAIQVLQLAMIALLCAM